METVNPLPAPAAATGPNEFDRSAWHCLACDYSVAHTIEDRCPECGEPFSPQKMALIDANRPIASSPWDRTVSFASWLSTLALVVLRPREFRERMSLVPNADAATLFAIANYAASALLGLTQIALALARFGVPRVESVIILFLYFLIATLMWVVGMTLIEGILASALSMRLRAKGRLNQGAVWRMLVHAQSAHMPVICACVLLGHVLALLVLWCTGPHWDHLPAAVYVVACVCWTPAVLLGLIWHVRTWFGVLRLSRPGGGRLWTLGLLAIALAMIAVCRAGPVAAVQLTVLGSFLRPEF